MSYTKSAKIDISNQMIIKKLNIFSKRFNYFKPLEARRQLKQIPAIKQQQTNIEQKSCTAPPDGKSGNKKKRKNKILGKISPEYSTEVKQKLFEQLMVRTLINILDYTILYYRINKNYTG